MKKKRFCINLFLCLFSFLFLTSCEEETSYVLPAEFQYKCYYNPIENKTTIQWYLPIYNQKNLSLKNESFTFNLYFKDTFVKEATFHYSIKIKPKKVETGWKTFVVQNEINAIKFISWSGEYDSFWKTYSTWIIVCAIVLLLGIIIFIIERKLENIGFDDFTDFFCEYWYFVLAICFFIFSALFPLFINEILNWVPFCIILGTIILFFLLTFIIDLIFEWIENIEFNRPSDKAILVQEENTAKFNDLSLIELKNFCKENGINGYSNLNKKDLLYKIKQHLKSQLWSMSKEELIEICNENEITIQTNLTKPEMIQEILLHFFEPEQEEIKKIEMVATPKIEKKDQVTFQDIVGLEKVKKIFNEKVILPIKHPELFEKYQKKSGGGILLYGLPGTGKTMFAKAIASEINATFIAIKSSDIKTKWYGETENKVKEIFDQAKKQAKTILFFDEFEGIGSKRTDEFSAGDNNLVTQLLIEMQGIESINQKNHLILIIAATNRPWAIDSAFLRPGRFDEKIYIPLPDFAARKAMFELKLKKVPTKDMDYDYLAKQTEGFNGADIEEICEKLKMEGIKKSLELKKDYYLTTQDFINIEPLIQTSVLQNDVELMNNYRKSL